MYGTTCCHLCEEAAVILQTAGVTAKHIDIAEDDDLLRRYGTRIPVVRRLDNDTEIGWPFDKSDLRRFLMA
ncbi:MAG: glutaredoxin family protein [Sideroxydans sp.]